MIDIESLTFKDKCFCFTGTMSELERKDAEKEVKARNGLTASKLNQEVDYLVIGSKPSPSWKFGEYGNKINEAITLRNKFNRPLIIHEVDFVDALSLNFPSTIVGEKTKYFEVRYICLDFREDITNLKHCFNTIAEKTSSLFVQDSYSYNEFFLFHNNVEQYEGDVTKYELRLISKHFHDADLTQQKDIISELLSKVVSEPNRIFMHEIIEGTSKFNRFSKIFN
jgi:stress-induced morphogen